NHREPAVYSTRRTHRPPKVGKPVSDATPAVGESRNSSAFCGTDSSACRKRSGGCPSPSSLDRLQYSSTVRSRSKTDRTDTRSLAVQFLRPRTPCAIRRGCKDSEYGRHLETRSRYRQVHGHDQSAPEVERSEPGTNV